MAITDDFSIDRQTKVIDHIAGTTVYQMEEFLRYLENLGDDLQSAGDDEYALYDPDIFTFNTVKNIALVNGWTITNTAAQYLCNGRISQNNGDTEWRGVDVVGSKDSADVIELIQDNAKLTNFWGTGQAQTVGGTFLSRMIIKVRDDGVDIDGARLRGHVRGFNNEYSDFTTICTEDVNTIALSSSSDLNNQTAAATVATWTSITNTEGLRLIDIDNNGATEPYYSEWNKGTQSINDVYERTKWIIRNGTSETLYGMNGELFRGITHSWAYDGESGTPPTTADEIAWGLRVNYDNEASGPFVIGEAVYFGGSNAKRGRILAIDDNGLTGTLIVSMEAGAPADNDAIAGQTSGATADVNGAPVGQATGGGVAAVLAIQDDGLTGNLHVQLLKGTAPSDNAICYFSTDATRTTTVNGSPTARTVNARNFLGVSTGSNVIASFGVGFEAADVGSADQFTALDNVTRSPPQNVTVTVGNLVIGDSVLLGPATGSALNQAQFALNTTLSGAAETSVVITTTIPSDTPNTGELLVENDNGDYVQVTYTSRTGSTFTINAADFSTVNATAGNNAFLGYIYRIATGTTESFTTVYDSDRELYLRVRAPNLVTFATTLTMTSAGGSQNVIRRATV